MVSLGWDGAITIVVLGLGLIVMMADWLAPHLTFTLMVGVLMAATVIDTRAGASGFSNTGVLTVVVLYAVAEGVSQTGGLDRLMSRVLGTTATNGRAALIRMMLPVAISSAFLNNTPIVALMIPILISWGRRCNVSPKLLLLPLSYASIFGGTTTLIGTSTNLVIAGLQSRRYAGTPDAAFNFFDITPYGLPYGVAGFAFTILIGVFLLPKDTGSRPREDLLLAAAVESSSGGASVAGKSLPDSGLLGLSGLKLLWVSRKGHLLYKTAPEEPRRRLTAWHRLTRAAAPNKKGKGHGSDHSLPAAQSGAGALHHHAAAAAGNGSAAADHVHDSHETHASHPTYLTVTIEDEGIGAPADVILQDGDILHFQGGLKRLQEEGERLGLILLTSDLGSVEEAALAAASGSHQLPAGHRQRPTGHGLTKDTLSTATSLTGGILHGAADDTHAHDLDAPSGGIAGKDVSANKHTGFRGFTKALVGRQADVSTADQAHRASGNKLGWSDSIARRQATLGWSGATMWLFTARVRKNAPIIGKTVDDVDFWKNFSAIVIGAELAGKSASPTNLGELVLGPQDLLVFTARNDFEYTNSAFGQNFTQVEFLRETKPKDFLLAVKVKAGAAGKDIATNGLQDIAGLYITAITRTATQQTFQDFGPNFELELDDILWFATDLDGVRYLLKDPRLEAVQAPDAHKLKGRQIYRHLVQVTVSPDSSLIGHTARQMRFRTYYEGVVLAIHRQSGYVSLQDVADVEMRAGDVLLLEADQSFAKRFNLNPAFGLVADVPRSSPLKAKLMWPALALTAAMVITQIISGFTGKSYIDLWPAAILTAAAMLAIGCMNADQAVGAIDWTVYITIAFAFGVSAAMEKSKVAAAIASIFVTISKAIGGRTAALGSMYLVTGLLSEVLTNNAAAALMYPIAANVGDDMQIQPKIMSIAVMLGASAAFISPFGYQCNLMVFTAGGYKTMDFVRIGTILQVWQLVAACVILSLPGQWMILCAISLAFVLATVAYAVACSLLAKRRAKRAKAARAINTDTVTAAAAP